MVAKNTIQEIVNTIVTEVEPEKIILFGSYAAGTERPDSDVDLCVVKKMSSDKTVQRRQRIALRKQFYGRQFPPIDIVLYTPEQIDERLALGDSFIRDILDNGTTVYES